MRAVSMRPHSVALDKMINNGTSYRVLDHGFVRVVDYMGNDKAIVQAARVSYGDGTKTSREDRALIRYLLRHRHTTPFEMCEVKLHVKMPIFVARQWIRHRTANVNEYSARYSLMKDEFYIPDKAWLEALVRQEKTEKMSCPDLFGGAPSGDAPPLAHMAAQSTDNKQGRGALLPKERARHAVEHIRKASKAAYNAYLTLLGKKKGKGEGYGVARELARAVLPVNIYTEWYWKSDVHNLLHFLALRCHAHAQYEIRAYAETIYNKIMRPWLPLTCEAFDDYRLGAVHLSAGQRDVVRRMVRGETPNYEDYGLSAREIAELKEHFSLP